MEPISMMMMLGSGLALQALGGVTSMGGAKASNQAQIQQIKLQQQVEAQRQHAMELDAHRKQLETVRNMQRARSLALSTATNQGAQFGSGLQGGYGQISGESGTNMLGINQGLEIGENVFGLNAQISQQKILGAKAGLQMQEGAAFSSFGNSLVGSAQPFGRLMSGFKSG